MNTYELTDLPVISDSRGSLGFAEVQQHVPFPIERVFYLFDVKPGSPRGAHAHHRGMQFLIVLRGSVRIDIDTGTSRHAVVLDSPSRGLHVPALHWLDLTDFSADAVCLVLASNPYDEADYIRDYSTFQKEVSRGR